MPVIDGEEVGPNTLLFNIKSDTDSVLIIISSNPIVGIHSVTLHMSVLFFGSLSALKTRNFVILLSFALYNGCHISFSFVFASFSQFLAL